MAEYVLKLYIAGRTPRSLLALRNLEAICEEHLKDRFELEVVDVLANPERAEADSILVTPTLLLQEPFCGRRIIGDLSVTDRVLAGLGLRPQLWTWRRGKT